MTKKIMGTEYPLAKIFSSDFDYSIPNYQRPYSWTEVQTGELFSDLYDFFIKEQDDSYFLGSIVLIREEGFPAAEVIDGQQRLTTLTIFLAALTSLLCGEYRSDFVGYINQPGRPSQKLKPKPRLALRERDRKFFTDYVQSLKLEELIALDPAQLDNESQCNIRRNTQILLQKLQAEFGQDADALCAFGSFIVQRCFLVVVSTPSQQSAFRVFSVLNSRGLDLLPTDIIKSDVIGKIPSSQQDAFTKTWEELEVEAGRDGFAEAFTHIRMIYAKEKARKSLLEEFREKVVARVVSSEALVNEVIEPYTEAYLIAKQRQYISTTNAADVNMLFSWLNRIDNSDWLPSAIRFLADQSMDSAYVLWFVRKLERLAAFMHICSYDVNQRIERYAQVLQGLTKSHSMISPLGEVELTAAEKVSFIRVLNGSVYTMPSRRRNYLILRLDSFMSDGAASYDSTLLTIEHVLPQTVSENSQWTQWWPSLELRNQWIHRISNLVPLNRRRNSAAQNSNFDVKKKAYFGGRSGVSSYVLTSQVLSDSAWTPYVVAQRQERLLKVLSENWELE